MTLEECKEYNKLANMYNGYKCVNCFKKYKNCKINYVERNMKLFCGNCGSGETMDDAKTNSAVDRITEILSKYTDLKCEVPQHLLIIDKEAIDRKGGVDKKIDVNGIRKIISDIPANRDEK